MPAAERTGGWLMNSVLGRCENLSSWGFRCYLLRGQRLVLGTHFIALAICVQSVR